MKRRQVLHIIQLLSASITLSALTFPALSADKDVVGISLPSKISARWIADGNDMVKVLKEKGFNPDLQYAEDDVPNQISQITSMINKGAKVLVVAAIDGSSLNNVLQTAADKGIKVIAYDRLIRGTKNVDYCVTFDNYQVGVMQGSYIEKALELKGGKGPFNIELFAGSADDSNSKFYYDGAMSVLKPYIDKAKLVVRSKQIGLDKVATLRWDPLVARARMDKILSSSYSDKDRVDVVLSPNDGLGLGVLASLKSAGYGNGSAKLPLVTGQDGNLDAVKSIAKGELRFTIFKDTRELAKATGNMVEAALSGKKPATNDTKSYNNGVKIVPAQLLKPVLVDAANWKNVFVGGGYYSEAQLK